MSLFLSPFRFLIISVNSSLIAGCDECLGFFVVMFLGVRSSFNGLFLLIYLLVLLGIHSGGGL